MGLLGKKSNKKKSIKAIKANYLKYSNKKHYLEADKPVRFYVEWHSDQEKEKYNNKVLWRFESGDELPKQVVSSYMDIYIPKKLCGKTYTLSARLEKDKNEDTNAIFEEVMGFCTPAVVDSQWTINDNGSMVEIKNRQGANPVPIGSQVSLHLYTEGLNDSDSLILEIYTIRTIADNLLNFKATRDDCKINNPYPIKCINGEINISFDTNEWRAKLKDSKQFKDTETIYIKLKASGKYVKDQLQHDIHAVGLVLSKEQQTNTIPSSSVPQNATTLTIGEKDANYAEYDHCTFKEISVVDPRKDCSKDINKLLFNEGKKYSELDFKRHFIKTEKVYFEFNKSNINAKAEKVLSQYINFWINSNVQIRLNGHTDVRGTEGYNKNLAYDRCLAVKQYLVNNGVKADNIIDNIGYNESQPIIAGDKLSATEHAENRRVEILFNVFEAKGNPIIYQTIAPSKETSDSSQLVTVIGDVPTRNKNSNSSTLQDFIDLTIKGYTNKNCFKNEENAHKPKITIYDQTDYKETFELIENEDNTISIPTCSKDFGLGPFDMIELLMAARISFMSDHKISDGINIYHVEMNTCAHYSRKQTPALQIIVYPDTWVSYHGRYDFPKDEHFFNGKQVDLVAGVKSYDDYYNKYIRYILSPGGALLTDYLNFPNLNDLVWAYYKDIADKFSIGIHTYSDIYGMTPYQITSYSEKHRTLVESTIALYALYLLIIEIMIMVLTRGKSAAAKLAKGYNDIKNMKALNKSMKSMKWVKKITETFGTGVSCSIMEPKVSENTGGYYLQTDDGDMAYVYKHNICAKPLIGISCTIKNGLKYQLGKAIKSNIEEPLIKEAFGKLFSKLGVPDMSMKVEINGTIGFNLSITMNTKSGKTTWKDLNEAEGGENVIDQNTLKLVCTRGVELKIALDVKIKHKVTLFAIDPISIILNRGIEVVELGLDAKVKTEINCAIYSGMNFVFDNNPYFEHYIHFAGIKAKYLVDVKGKVNNEKTFEYQTNNGELKEVTLLKEFYFPFGRTYLGFNKENENRNKK